MDETSYVDISDKSSNAAGRVISRQQFLRGDFTGRNQAIRPPWAVAEKEFVTLCSGCGECVDHCPTALLREGRGGFPEVDFAAGECDFCTQCVDFCTTGALKRDSKRAPWDILPWDIVASIGDACLAFRNVVCRSCAEHCEPGAIRFHLGVGRTAQPQVIDAQCTGCGACVAPCPANAISFIHSNN